MKTIQFVLTILFVITFFQINAQTSNLALSGTVSQSSTIHNGVASRAIDDNANGSFSAGSVTHTKNETNAWWQVEFEFDSRISRIEIYNRTDVCCVNRLSDFTVEILDENGDVSWSQFFSDPPAEVLSIDLRTTGKALKISRNGVLSLAEVSVTGIPFTTDSSINLALSGTASQSSTAYNGLASLAIDGDTNGKYTAGSTTHTNVEDNAWWQVELAQISNILTIEIYNRTDACCINRLSNYTVTILDETGDVTYSRFPFDTPSPVEKIDLRSTTGKTVRISLEGGNPLSLAEVRVIGTPNIALNGTASQSSTAHGGSASRAIDGNKNANYSAGSTTHTKVEDNAWWQVELAQNSDISKIVIYNRTDECCAARLADFTVEILDEKGNVVYSEYYGVRSGGPYRRIQINLEETGKTVRVNIKNGPLSLAEVRVFGNPAKSAAGNRLDSSNQITNTAVSVFPNPASEKLFIDLPENMMDQDVNLVVADLSGKQHIIQTLQSNHKLLAELNLGHLNNGLYILQLNTKSDSAVEKIYVNHNF